METIKNYLDSMFNSLPDKPEVRRAKEELYQMMEDKYHELKAEGKLENEAIGIVITEFGNLDEIKEELGISAAREEAADYQEEGRYVSLVQAQEYLEMSGKYSVYTAVGVMLCIFSPIALIFLCGLSTMGILSENLAGFVGIMALFALIIVAVGIFIYTGNQMEDFEYLKKEVLLLDKGTEEYIREEKRRNKASYSIKKTIGVILCIISVLPLLGCGFLLEDQDAVLIFCTCFLLLVVGFGVLILIIAGTEEESYHVLLQEEDFKKNKKGKELDTIGTVYWCLVTAVYLGWSFWTFRWGFTWIIWPVAGVLYGAIAAIYNAVRGKE